MYCSKCGTKNSESAKFCSNCGNSFYSNDTINNEELEKEEKKVEKETPTALIIISWLLMLFSLFPLGEASIIISIAILFCAIILLFSKNSTGITNGVIILVIWIITFLIGFAEGFNRGINY